MASEVGPETLRTYLANAGWHAQDGVVGGATLWTTADAGDEFEILLPTNREPRDFPLRMFDVLRTLAIVEDRPIESIVADLGNQDTDTMTFRLLPNGPRGTVPLFDGVKAVEGVRELVLATAYASVSPRPLVLQGRRPRAVLDFVSGVRLGAPQVGSWMVSVQMSVSGDIADPSVQGSPTSGPSSRQVSLQMHRSVRATLAAAGESLRSPGIEPFERRVNEGVSANVCDALARLGRGSAFEIRFAWAQRQPPNVGAGRFRFDRPIVDALRQAHEALRVGLPDGRIELTGSISKLSREARRGGAVTVEGVARLRSGDAEVRVDVSLSPEWYNIAVDAHRQERQVRIIGFAHRGRVDTVQIVEISHQETEPPTGGPK